MARSKDESKKTAVMQAACELFAKKGYHNTSIADIKEKTGFSAGLIYTYFSGKQEIMTSLINEGWESLYTPLLEGLRSAKDLDEKIEIINSKLFEVLNRHSDLINILLSETLDLTGLIDKLNSLVDIVEEVSLSSLKGSSTKFTPRIKTGILVYFLGIFHTSLLINKQKIDLSIKDLKDFLAVSIRGDFSSIIVPSDTSSSEDF